jgi:hypothetical protein
MIWRLRRMVRNSRGGMAKKSWPLADRAGGGGDQTENGPPHRGFAAAGFADKPKRFAGLHIEADIIDGLYISNGSGKDSALDGEPGS